MSQTLSYPRHLVQVAFANENPWWNQMQTAESFHHKDDVHISRGQMSRRLPSLAEMDNDETYFD